MRQRLFSHYLRLLTLALAAMCAVGFNHRHVAVVRVVADAGTPASPGAPVVVAGSHRVIVRERVSLESVHADAVTVAGPAVAWLPLPEPLRDPLGAWLKTKTLALGALPTSGVRAVMARAAPAFARLLGASVAPQAP